MRCHNGPTVAGASTVSEPQAEADSTTPTIIHKGPNQRWGETTSSVQRWQPTKGVGDVDTETSIVFGQERPVKAAQRELAARRPELKLEKRPKVPFGSICRGGKRGTARDWIDPGAERRIGVIMKNDETKHASPRGDHQQQIL